MQVMVSARCVCAELQIHVPAYHDRMANPCIGHRVVSCVVIIYGIIGVRPSLGVRL